MFSTHKRVRREEGRVRGKEGGKVRGGEGREGRRKEREKRGLCEMMNI